MMVALLLTIILLLLGNGQDFNKNNESKKRLLELTVLSSAMKGSAPLCFTVSNQTETWLLQASSDDDLYEWVNAINSHIHFLYARIHGLRVGGFGDESEAPLYFMQIGRASCRERV